jgi:hypothetical protein
MFSRFTTQGRFSRRRAAAGGGGSPYTSDVALNLAHDEHRICNDIRRRANAVFVQSTPTHDTAMLACPHKQVKSKTVEMAPHSNPVIVLEHLRQVRDSVKGIVQYIHSVASEQTRGKSWIQLLFQPITLELSQLQEFQAQMRLWDDMDSKPKTDTHLQDMTPKDPLSTVFQMQKVTPLHDPMFSYFVASVFPFIRDDTSVATSVPSASPSGTEGDCSYAVVNRLHGEIVDIILSYNKNKPHYTLEQFKQDVLSWKKQKLMFPLLILARMDSTFDKDPIKGIPPEASQAIQTLLQKLRKQRDWDSVGKILSEQPVDQLHPFFLAYLEHVGNVMLATDYSKDLAFFSRVTESDSELTAVLCHSLQFLQQESILPVFMRCPEALGYQSAFSSTENSHTWGVPHLALDFIEGTRALQIVSTSSSLAMQVIPMESASTDKATKSNHVRNSLLPSVSLASSVARLGEALLHPVIAQVLQNSNDLARFLRIKVDTVDRLQKYDDPVKNLRFMQHVRSETETEVRQCISLVTQEYDEFVGKHIVHKKLSSPRVYTAWRLELPCKMLTLTPAAVSHLHIQRVTPGVRDNGYNFAEPHQLPRKMHGDKSSYKPIHGVCMSHDKTVTQDTARNTVVRALKFRFKDGIDEVVEKNGQQHTVLHESLACFCMHEPVLHTEIPLHASLQWNSDYEDKRYAETQLANGGSARFRDWCNFMEKKTAIPQKSKIDSHVIRATEVHETIIPLSIGASQQQWVHVTSSMPLPQREIFLALPTPSSDEPHCSLSALGSVLKNKFKNSIHLVPTRSKDHVLTKENIHFYTDTHTETIMMVYACENDPDKNLDFMLFKMP